MENIVLSKRSFLGYLSLLPAGYALGRFLENGNGGGFISSAFAAEEAPAKKGAFTLPKLPYGYDALSAAIDPQTMKLHHDKHHQAYIDKLNGEVIKDEALQGKTIDDIVKNVSKYNKTVRNNGGGHWNHSFFWQAMTPKKTTPSEKFSAAITRDFGSMDAFKTAFEEAGTKQFGSGWAWLIVDDSGKLKVTSTPNQDNPLMDDVEVKGTPILGNDVWEHAYYLRYFNKRADYLKAWWKVVDWNRASSLYEKQVG